MVYRMVEEREPKAELSCRPSLLSSRRSNPIHRSEWRPIPDNAHPFKSKDPITPSLPFQGRPRHLPSSSPSPSPDTSNDRVALLR